jgi:hypothetical protein
VGGLSNVSSGPYAVSGGSGNTASGEGGVALGSGNIAQGLQSTAIGFLNRALGNYSFALGYQARTNGSHQFSLGEGNDVLSGSQYSLISGYGGKCYLRTQKAHSARTSFNNDIYVGNAQISELIASKSGALTTGGTTILSLDGTGVTNLIIPDGNNRVWNVVASWTAVVTAITGTATGVSVGDVATECNLFAFKKIAGVSSIVGTVTSVASHNDASMATAAMGYTAGASQELIPTFSAPIFVGGGSLTIRVVLKLMLTEVAY